VRVPLCARFAAKRAMQKFFAAEGSGAEERGAQKSMNMARREGTLTLPSPAHFAGEGIEQNRRAKIGRGARALRHAGAFGAIVAMTAAIAGCAGAEPAPTVQPLMVQVPVLHETLCPVPVLTHPALPIAGLKPGSSPADTMRAYAAAVTILKGAVRERDAVLAGCGATKHPAQAQAENTQ
jgi:hypothetical protein